MSRDHLAHGLGSAWEVGLFLNRQWRDAVHPACVKSSDNVVLYVLYVLYVRVRRLVYVNREASLHSTHFTLAGRPATPRRIHNGRIHKHIFAHREECRQRKTPFAFLSLQHRFGLIRVNVSHPFSSSSLISHRAHHRLHCTHLRLRQSTCECAYLSTTPVHKAKYF